MMTGIEDERSPGMQRRRGDLRQDTRRRTSARRSKRDETREVSWGREKEGDEKRAAKQVISHDVPINKSLSVYLVLKSVYQTWSRGDGCDADTNVRIKEMVKIQRMKRAELIRHQEGGREECIRGRERKEERGRRRWKKEREQKDHSSIDTLTLLHRTRRCLKNRLLVIDWRQMKKTKYTSVQSLTWCHLLFHVLLILSLLSFFLVFPSVNISSLQNGHCILSPVTHSLSIEFTIGFRFLLRNREWNRNERKRKTRGWKLRGSRVRSSTDLNIHVLFFPFFLLFLHPREVSSCFSSSSSQFLFLFLSRLFTYSCFRRRVNPA